MMNKGRKNSGARTCFAGIICGMTVRITIGLFMRHSTAASTHLAPVQMCRSRSPLLVIESLFISIDVADYGGGRRADDHHVLFPLHPLPTSPSFIYAVAMALFDSAYIDSILDPSDKGEFDWPRF